MKLIPNRLLIAASILLTWLPALSQAAAPAGETLLKKYVDDFNRQDNDLYPSSIPNTEAFDYLKKNIPFFDAPDEDFMRTYYFRWWVYRKHLRSTPDGHVVTEFLPDVPWAGKHNAISCPLGHHLMEGRWLRDRSVLRENLRFWLEKTDGGHLRSYSTWVGSGLWDFHQVAPDQTFLIELLPHLIKNYEGWEKSNLCSDGLFYQTDDRDGMEVSIGGSGRRPTLNSYLYGDARVIARIARLAGNAELSEKYDRKAAGIRKQVLDKMWDEDAGFFKVLPGKEGTSKAPVAELLGYIPWLTGLPGTEEKYARAWRLLTDPKGFQAPFGPTTAEQRHPQFAVSEQGHECQWNGPSWPYLTSAVLKALAETLQDGRPLPCTRSDYFKLLTTYTHSHRRTTEDGQVLPWIDENLDPYQGTWLARKILMERKSAPKERGKDYNHSSYCDLLISGLIGVRSREDNTLELDPLLPPAQWRYFRLDHLSYHDRELTVVWDEDGTRYGGPKGLRLLVDGKEVAARPDLGKLVVELPSR